MPVRPAIAPPCAATLLGVLLAGLPIAGHAQPALRPPHPLVHPTPHDAAPTFLRHHVPQDHAQRLAAHVRLRATALANQSAPARQRKTLGLQEACARLAHVVAHAQRYQRSSPTARDLQGQLPWPVDALAPVAGFGTRMRPESRTIGRHTGLSFNVSRQAPVRAIASGVVLAVTHIPGMGNVVIVDHQDGIHGVYAQMRNLLVVPYDIVAAGTPIGSGAGPSSWGGDEIYFELRVDGVPVDPAQWLGRSR